MIVTAEENQHSEAVNIKKDKEVMTTIIGIIAVCCALWAAGRRVPRMHRLEEAVIAQQEQLLHLRLYVQWVEDNTLELLDELYMMQDTLADNYPTLIEQPKPDYPPAYDKWGEFDA